jgi:TolB-like protein/class 3 adenylate cyclase/Tfp pilus assembly protein PilF
MNSSDVKFEIGHVLFIDIVGYSKLLINEQSEQLQKLKDIVRGTEQFRSAEAEGKLLRLPTGDGSALVFRTNPEAPVLCALEISKAVTDYPELRVRMGIHSGPVNEVTDLNEQANIAGAGINIAQRVMDCGDAGHILLSKRVAEDLAQYRQWQPLLHDLGEVEVKHGVCVNVFNLYTDDVGNAALPSKLAAAKEEVHPTATPLTGVLMIVLLALLVAVGVPALIFTPALLRSLRSASKNETTSATAGNTNVLEKSIAVLPFENLSEEKQNEFFADGVQDEILTDLAKVADLKVISRTSVIGYRGIAGRNLRKIGQELGVAHLLEGSVQRAGNRVRVNAQLIDARTDAHLWAQTYDRNLADVFAIQSEIAKTIADQLQARLSPSEKSAIEQPPTTDVTAFDLYSRAKSFLLNTTFSANNTANYLQAAELLNQAVARDPTFFDAYCQLAHAHDQLYFVAGDHTSARLAPAEAAIQAAFRLRPDAGEAHLARAENFYRGYLDYDGALGEVDVARRTLPNDPRIFALTGYITRRQGKHEEGLRNLQRSLELDPRNFNTLQQIAVSYQILRRYAEMGAMLDRELAIKPDDLETKVARVFVDLDWKADPQPLHQMIDQIRTKDPAGLWSIANSWFTCALAERDAVAAQDAVSALGETHLENEAVILNRPFLQGVIARMTKDDVKARAAFTAARAEQEKTVQAQPNYGPALCVLGLIDAGLGRKEDALREAERAVELLPVEKDSLIGAHVLEYLARTAAWLGEKDLACEQLAIATRVPGTISYGQLKLLPYWDPLRGDLRFERSVASLAPKDTK